MKYEFVDPKKRSLRIRVTDMDDLWFLHTILRPGDFATMRTTREVKQGERGSGSSRRLPMILTIKVLKTEFQPFTNKLRVRGIVVKGPDRFGIQGSHHTFSIGVGDEIVLEREEGWPKHVLKILDETREYQGCILIVALDYDEIGVGTYRIQGIRKVMDEDLRIPGKLDESREKVIGERLSEKARQISEIYVQSGCNAVVVGGPGFLKNRFTEILRDMLPHTKIMVENASMGGWVGVKEILRRGLPEKIMFEERLRKAQVIVEEVLHRISTDPGTAGVGLDECIEASLQSTIQDLVLTDEMLASYESGLRERVDRLLSQVHENGGRIHVVPSRTPIGELLTGMGGIACLYRFRIYREP